MEASDTGGTRVLRSARSDRRLSEGLLRAHGARTVPLPRDYDGAAALLNEVGERR